MDPSLGISDKILSNEEKKPQAKHLIVRAEYLLRVLKKKLGQAAKPVSRNLFHSYSSSISKELPARRLSQAKS